MPDDFSINLDRAGLGEMLKGPEVASAVRQVAEKGKAIAEAMAQDFRVTGEYADSFEVDVRLSDDGTRVEAELVNTSDHGAAVEFGSSRDRRPHRVLGRTLVALEAERE